MKFFTLMLIAVLSSAYIVGYTSSVSDCPPTGYCPWDDLDDDGDIDIFDVVEIAGRYGTSGEPVLGKAALEYNSGWIDIIDKRGQYFNITHNQNSTDIMIEITGKEASDDGPHQNHYGLTTYSKTLFEWNQTYGGTNADSARSVVQTMDGGYAIAGETMSFHAAGLEVWLVKTDASGNQQWNQTYGGLNSDSARSVVQTADGGITIAGYTQSFGAGSSDAWLIKTDASGNHVWSQTYGGTSADRGYSVVQTADGGYAIAGETLSFGAGNYDFWLIKTDASGNQQWNQTYGGLNSDSGWSVVQTADGGYALAGYTWSFGAGSSDAWLIKTDASGNQQWNQTYGGTSTDYGVLMVQTVDGGYALAGYTYSFGAGSSDVWLVKTDAAGNHLWNQTYGGTSADRGYSVVQTADGGYALAGHTQSFSAGSSDAWLIKTDASGNQQWNQTHGGSSADRGYSVVQTADGGYAIAGETLSFGAGNYDFWLIKAYELGYESMIEVEYGLAWTASAQNTITLYRGEDDPYWNYVRVRVWKIKETP